MSLSYSHSVLKKPTSWRSTSVSVSLDSNLKISQRSKDATMRFQGPKERIKELFSKVELSVSSYDTAWVAMVPSPSSPQFPYFPQCVIWLLENQLPDGSWGLPHSQSVLIKDALSSTLACVLALKRWNVGQENVKKGIHFIVSNFASATNEKQHSPIGFDIIFPGMIDYAKDMGLSLPLSPSILDTLLQKRYLEFKRASISGSERRKAYLAYVAEGLGKLQDWNGVMNYQRENGSLFNSPSTTAAAFIHLQDANCLNYLCSVLERFGNAVPTTYPSDTYARLCMVDILVGLGIDRHFQDEIRVVLDETYGYWLQGEEEVFLDPVTCAMAFRILRTNGYDVSSDALAQFDEKQHFCDPLGGRMEDAGALLELYKASEIMILHNEPVLENLNFWLSRYLKQELSNDSLPEDGVHKYTSKEVEYTLRFPHYASLERLQSRRNIENYNANSLRILKTASRCLNINNRNFLHLAVEDFNFCQAIHCKELQHLELWVKENKLDKLKFARQKLVYCYFSGAATLFSPELSDARMSWAKNAVLTTVIDDFFDYGGSKEELVNLIELVEKWDGNQAIHCSEQVQIIFSVLYNTINELGNKGFAWQRRSVTRHIIEIWLSLLYSMMREAEWARNNSVPTMDEYMTNGYVSVALGPIVLPALYFVGPELSEEVVKCTEYHNLYKLMSTCGRLLNDVQGFKREAEQRKLNGVLLQMMHSSGTITEEEAIREIRVIIDSNRRQLLELVLKTEGSVVPRACKDVFWQMSKILHLFYIRNDGFSSPSEMVKYVNAVIYDPIDPIEL